MATVWYWTRLREAFDVIEATNGEGRRRRERDRRTTEKLDVGGDKKVVSDRLNHFLVHLSSEGS